MSSNINTDETQKAIRAASFLLFEFKQTVNDAILNMFPQHAQQSNLERIGRDRNAPRFINEDLDEYRDRIINAFDFNQGIGKVEDIIRAMRGLDYVFNSFTQGDTTLGTGSFNLLVGSLGGLKYDDSEVYNGPPPVYNSPTENDVNIELVQAGAPTQAQIDEIREQLRPVLRASSDVLTVSNVAP